MTQVLLLSFRQNKFLVSLLIPIQFFFPWVAGCHLIIWDVFHKTISSLFFSLLVFPTTPFDPYHKDVFSSSLVAEVGIFFSILLFQWYIFYYFFRRHCDVALFTHHLDSWGSCSFLAYPFNRSVVFSFEFSNLIKFSLLSQLESCLKSFLPIVPFFQ